MRLINKYQLESTTSKRNPLENTNQCLFGDDRRVADRCLQTNTKSKQHVSAILTQAPVAKVTNAKASATNTTSKTTSTIITDGALSSPTIQVQQKIVRKTPKFPSRERHMAIRRKKPSTMLITVSQCKHMGNEHCENANETQPEGKVM